MKRLLRYITITLSLLLAFGCSDFLEVEDEGYLDNDYVFSNMETINAFFVTTYASLPIEDFNYEGGEFGTYPDDGQDNPMAWGAEIRGNSLSSSCANKSWEAAFKCVRYCNLLIENLDSSPILSDTERQEYIGEARFLRAFTYYFLVRLFGGLPLIDFSIDYSRDDPTLNLPRTQESKIWEFIFEDLDYAIDNMTDEKVYGRANKYVALALKSRAALYAASIARYGDLDEECCVGINEYKATYYYEQCMEASKSLIEQGGYELFDSYTDREENFKQSFLEARTSPEVILAKDFDYYSTGSTHSFDCQTLPHQFYNEYGEKYLPVIETVESFEFADGTPGINITDTYESAKSISTIFANRDPRLYASIVLPHSELHGQTVIVQDGVICRGEMEIDSDYNRWFDTVEEIFVDEENANTVMGTGPSGGIAMSLTGFFIRKYVDEDLDEKYRTLWSSQTDYIVFRLAETYLNYAEAAIELGVELDTALEYVNTVKRRAGVAEIADVSGLTMDRVTTERRSELCFEGFKFFDMVRRRTLLDEFNTSTNSNLRYGLEIYLDYTNNQYTFNRESVKRASYSYSRLYYREIPSDELAKNDWPNNPGY